MGKWKEAVREELQRFHDRTGRTLVERQELLDQALPRLEREFPNAKTPSQTLSRELQELRDLGEVAFLDNGTYRILSSLPFEVGEQYRRMEIHDEFGGNRQSGIAPSADFPYIFLFTGESGREHGYKDEFRDDGTFVYTGEGQKGDMEFVRGNRAIRDHQENDNELHLFETVDDGMVIYLGQYSCEDWFREELSDTSGDPRSAIRFKLVPIGGKYVEIESPETGSESLEELYRRAKGSTAGDSGTQTTTTTTSYTRSELVKEFARRIADGVCQGCGEGAPFVDKNGEPFLEVHHVYRRSDGGVDDPSNVIAICPNCHRRVHHGKDGEAFNESLIEKVESRTVPGSLDDYN